MTMTTRLDRLFILLESGGSAITRKVAAEQLGDVVKLHPHELNSLLSRLTAYLSSKSWETRIAATQAVAAILKNIPQWNPVPNDIKTEESKSYKSCERLSLSDFNIHNVLEKKCFLMGANEAASDFKDEDTNIIALSETDLTQRQRRLINERLGLVAAEAIGFDTQELVSNEDLLISIKSEKSNNRPAQESVLNIVNGEMNLSGLSSRELNRAKRRARMMKQKSIDEEGPDHKRPRLASIRIVSEPGSCSDEESIASDWSVGVTEVDQSRWPLDDFCEQLMVELFSAAWETRHGAASALREVVRLAGEGGGKLTDQNLENMSMAHHVWLEDLSARLICVLALDRFGDFVSDQVVAPVRESVAQALGAVLHLMSEAEVVSVMKLLRDLLTCSDWEVRHGGLLGLKYLLAVREDLRSNLLEMLYPLTFQCLSDEMDDVVSVAASCLVEAADFLGSERSRGLVGCLWDALLDTDDLTASTSSVLMLLTKLLNCCIDVKGQNVNLASWVPRLWPFLYHKSKQIRVSTLTTLDTLTCLEPSTVCESPDTVINGTVPWLWLVEILQPSLCHLFQRSLLETCPQNLELIFKIWRQILARVPVSDILSAVCPLVSSWMCLSMAGTRVPLEPMYLLIPQHLHSEKHRRRSGPIEFTEPVKWFLGGLECEGGDIVGVRCAAAKMIGYLSHYLVQPMPGLEYPTGEDALVCYIRLLVTHLTSQSAMQRFVAASVIREWVLTSESLTNSKLLTNESFSHPLLTSTLHNCLTQVVYYDEIATSFTRLQQDTRDFISMLRHYRLEVGDAFSSASVLTLEQIEDLVGPTCLTLFTQNRLRPKVHKLLNERRTSIECSVSRTFNDQMSLSIMTQAVMAGAIIHLNILPEKLNPVIKPLMESVKRESCQLLQKNVARDLTKLLSVCVHRDISPNGKIVSNLANFVCADEEVTPKIDNMEEQKGILTLLLQGKEMPRKNDSSISTIKKVSRANDKLDALQQLQNSEVKRLNKIQRCGCTIVLQYITQHFSDELPQEIPQLWQLLLTPFEAEVKVGYEQLVINQLFLLELLIPHMTISLLQQFESRLPALDVYVYANCSEIRHMAARVMAQLARAATAAVMKHVVETVVSNLASMDLLSYRQGAVECIYTIVDVLGFVVVPYSVMLIVPLLGGMSDPDSSVRLLSTLCFAHLIRVLPLEGGIPDPPSMGPLLARKERERNFMTQLLDPKQMDDYAVPVPVNATLRSYQQTGINWLAFLNRYKLHGILCDDMGLGKTLQSICIIAGDHYDLDPQFKKSDTSSSSSHPLKSLVVCPPTLTGHWVDEVERFVSKEHLNPLHYTGPPGERNRLRSYFSTHNIIVASYDIVRNDIDFFKTINWNYIVLDEGHILKNAKTKSCKAIKMLIGSHRLILSGTPIQNNVLDLWSLFDFLMPGFLGSEKQFQARYAKPILLSRDAKSSSSEQEAGVLAMEALHRQVLPFLLRRLKEDVLQDLPPKITQDYYCELSPLQHKLYEDFSRSSAKQNVENNLQDENVVSQSHVFQALQYLRKVCNHPKLVLTPSHPHFDSLQDDMKKNPHFLDDINHSSKLPALKQLLLDCGIGTDISSDATETVVCQHRALVFCQLKGMLDIVENDLLKCHLPKVTFLRLDGSVPAANRHSIVRRFNSDPSIDLLLLTTQVGGLGLNLVGADTVIFVEHDWNPMRDLQAMDRAHRIGQKKVVNVYRLITRGTLEEKIMGLQKFKLATANTIINEENSSLLSMSTDQLLDLFSVGSNKTNEPSGIASGSSKDGNAITSGGLPAGARAALQNLPELWNESQYETEFNLASFMSSLKGI